MLDFKKIINIADKFRGMSKKNGLFQFAHLNHLEALVNAINANDPRPYKVYTARLRQEGASNAPTVEILYENTIGDIVWSWSAEGTYNATLPGAFADVNGVDPVWTTVSNLHNTDNYNMLQVSLHRQSANVVTLRVKKMLDFDGLNTSVEAVDDNVNRLMIEIRVYN
jgi:hypothetical protein